MTKKYEITRTHMIRFRALLMIKLDRDLGWADFNELLDLPRSTSYAIRHGIRPGSISTAQKIMVKMAEYGIMVHLAELERK